MKTYQIKDSDGRYKMEITELKREELKPHEVRVKWKASSLNFHDYLVCTSAIKVPDGRVPMSDGVGVITEIGSGVGRFKKGDLVMGMFFPYWIDGDPQFNEIMSISGESVNGFMCEESCMDEAHLTLAPKNLSIEECAILPTAGLTAWNALFNNGKLNKGDKVLIQGTGGMSLCALILARYADAEIYATTSSDAKAERLKSMDVKEVVNYKEDERWGKTIFKMAGMGVDHILDAGGGSTMKQSIEAATIGGHIHAIGILGNGRKGEITFPKLFFKFLKMQGLAVGSRKMQEDMVHTIEAHDIRFSEIVDRSFGFEDLDKAFDYQMSGEQFGKIVMRW